MSISKVVFYGETLIDISDSTVTPATLAAGVIGYNAKGERITGTMEPGESDALILHGVNVTDNSGALTVEGMTVINDEGGNLVTQFGGMTLPTLTTPGVDSDILSGKQFIDGNGNVVTGKMPTQVLPTPSISVSNGGLITATDTLTDPGYVASGTKTATKQLTTQAAKTITPSTAQQTAVASGRYTTGEVKVAAVPTQTKSATPSATAQTIKPDSGKFLSQVTINGDSNLAAANIKSGVSIFGVNGSYEGTGGGSSSGGGATLKTCTLSYNHFNYPYNDWYYPLYYTSVENGEVVYKAVEGCTESITVLCDSIIIYETGETEEYPSQLTGGFETINKTEKGGYCIKAPSTAGANGELFYIDPLG